MVEFFFTKYMANVDISEPPRRADSKYPIFFFFFADFGVWVTSGAWWSVLVGFWGARQLSRFLSGGGGGSSHQLTPPGVENPPTCRLGRGLGVAVVLRARVVFDGHKQAQNIGRRFEDRQLTAKCNL